MVKWNIAQISYKNQRQRSINDRNVCSEEKFLIFRQANDNQKQTEMWFKHLHVCKAIDENRK